MSTQSSNAGCGKILGYVLLIGLGLLLLRSAYYALSYVGLNTLLALDQSAYAQLTHSHWAGYALLGFGLGAAGGAMAAQRRFGLSRGITVAGWLVVLALLGVVYAGTAEAGLAELPQETTYSAPTQAPSPAEPKPVAAPKSPAAPASLPLAYKYLKAHGQRVPAAYNGFVAGMQQPGQLRRLYDYFRGQGQRVPASYDDFVANMAVPTKPQANETDAATDDPETDEAPATTEAEDATEPEAAIETAGPSAAAAPARQPRLTGLVLPGKKKASAATLTGLTAPAHPTGHQQYTGQVGTLRATYSLDWQPTGELSGSYYYNQQPAIIYRLSGATGQGGELHLVEFTRGRQTARCVLQPQGAGFAGTMLNTDGRQLPMSIE